MSNIGGKKREQQEFVKKVGLIEVSVIAINPNEEDYKELLGIELAEESKAAEYLGESKDGNSYVRIDFWLEEVKTKEKQKVTFFLEDKVRENKEGTKKQYINNVGVCSWADDPNNLPEWFTANREYRLAKSGEEEFYEFLRTWLGGLDYRHPETTLELDFKKLMKGNVTDLRDQMGGEWEKNVVVLLTVVSREKDGEIKEYQAVYNKAFLSPFSMKYFRTLDYDDSVQQSRIKTKKPKELKAHEKFVLKVTGEYGCKDAYILKDAEEYDASKFLISGNEVIDESDASY